jgi:hypothetical protein
MAGVAHSCDPSRYRAIHPQPYQHSTESAGGVLTCDGIADVQNVIVGHVHETVTDSIEHEPDILLPV